MRKLQSGESAAPNGLTSNADGAGSPWAFLLLVTALFVPFYVLGALSALQLLPALPISALGAVCPVIAAAILVYRRNGRAGLAELLKRSFDFGRVKKKVWYIPAVLLLPLIMALSFVVMRLGGTPLPFPHFSVVTTIALFAAFFIFALGEELGWSGYAIEPLQNRFGALWGALLLGAFWAVIHYIPLLEAKRSLTFIAWWSLGTAAYRVIITWLYNNMGRSVFAAALFHTMINLTWQLFPVNGSYYDPRVTGLIAAGVAIVIVFTWGPRTLERNRSLKGQP